MIADNAGPGSTVGGDKNYDTADFVAGCRERGCTPHVSQNNTHRRSAIDGRTTRHPGYRISAVKRKRIEEPFGWMKNVILESERARLAHSNMMLEREPDNKLMNVQAALASIAHEVRQPLAAIEINSHAALRWLGRTPPDYDEVRAALNRITGNSQRTSEVFEAFRTLFGKAGQARQAIDVNEIVRDVLQSFHGELKSHGVTTHTELTSGLPLADGNSVQLREVVSNLVSDAIEAMIATTNLSPVLAVKTELRGRDAIVVSVRDSGPGIDPERLDSIFGAFVTTKAHGTGLGLAICRMIIQNHGGQLSASSDGKSGALFQFVLPIDGKGTGPAN
jgi:signal transduction histidine kinase